MTERNNNLVYLSIDNISIEKANPRFAGLNYNTMDPLPYGNAIDEMYNSMVEHYTKHSTLLMQPIVVTIGEDDNYIVEAGYTRAITFITRYKDLCDNLKVEALSIPAIVYDNIDVVDSLMENIVRNEQHYITVSYAINTASKIQNIKSIANQLGMSVNTALKMKSLVNLTDSMKKLCFENVIELSAALEICQWDIELQEQAAEYIVDHDITKLASKGLKFILDRLLPSIVRGMYTGEFTDNNGFVWPSIDSDSNYYLLDMEYKVKDESLMTDRINAYNEMIIEKYNLDVKSKDDYNVYNGYTRVELGTNPNEIAMYNYDNIIEFYVKDNDLRKVNHIESYIEKKKETIESRADSKMFALKQNKVFDMVKKEIIDAFTSGDFYNDAIHNQVINMLGSYFNNKQKSIFQEITGEEFSVEAAISNDPINTMMLCKILSDGYISKDIKAIMEEYGIDYEYLQKRAAEEIEDDKIDIENNSKNKIIETDDILFDLKVSMEDLNKTWMTDTDIDCVMSVYPSTNLPANEKVLKYISRSLGQPYRGNPELMKMRLANVIKSMGTIIDDNAVKRCEKANDQFKFVKGLVADGFNAIDFNNKSEVGMSIVASYKKTIDTLIINGLISLEADKIKWKTDSILKSISDAKEFYGEYTQLFFNNVYKHLNTDFNMVVLNKSGKLTILRKS